ncbi:MAG: hypothetical protein A3K19_19175 [Lentisphaerae bacterium RIFOXYB12_FULL_65_16]|nr:MAG: hypothetical protein A3K18_02215 [Lentisphaerae bacterium RIFOXYA12_64_32]OGV91577.1 MAG: hypothetical protein A3K19_19175 [Lentisphaerae bacterium RIFOXYB12_FULL_65_16]
MNRIKDQLLPFERITREPGHHFFGYYDIQPFSGDGRFHLCNRVPFMDRLQDGNDRAELGMVRLHDGTFVPLAETYAWNFQQGTMLRWHPAKPNEEIIYNTRLQGTYKAVVKNIVTGEQRVLSRAVANVDPTGRWGLSVNFSRMFDFRPGYGYAGLPDPFLNIAAPADDGIFLVNIATGESKLILSLDAMRQLFPDAPETKMKLMVNHINFNTDGTRFLFLLRNMAMPATTQPKVAWKTATLTANTDGSDIHIMNGFGGASHYIWRDPEHVLIYADIGLKGKLELYLVRDRTPEAQAIDPVFFTHDGHCSYSPDLNYILYDSYPDAAGYRKLILYDVRKRKGETLATLFSSRWDALPNVDIRCDLHPRWNRDGSAISFDSVHEGHRHIYCMDVSSLVSG